MGDAMTAKHAIGLLTLVGILACSAPARAQDAARAQDEIAITDIRIDRATTLLATNPSAEAQAALDRARDLQLRARSALSARQPAIAVRLTLEARDLANRAISIVQGLPDPARVTAQLERTREIIQGARDRIGDCTLDRAHFLFQVAIAMEERAEDAAAEERYLAALQLTTKARDSALRAMRLCNLGDDARVSAERALRRTDEIIVRAQDAVAGHGDARARDALARATMLQSEARRQFVAEHFDPCLRFTQSARASAYRAIRLTGGTI